MRGGYLHNDALLAPLTTALENVGARVRLEVPVRLAATMGFVDAVADGNGLRLVVEVELTAKRVARDIAKAMVLKADHLIILNPDARVRAATWRQVQRYTRRFPVLQTQIHCFTLPQALTWVRNSLLLFAKPNESHGNHSQPGKITSDRHGVFVQAHHEQSTAVTQNPMDKEIPHAHPLGSPLGVRPIGRRDPLSRPLPGSDHIIPEHDDLDRPGASGALSQGTSSES